MANRKKRNALRKQLLEKEELYLSLLWDGKIRHQEMREVRLQNRRFHLKARAFLQAGMPYFLAIQDWFAQGIGKNISLKKAAFIRQPKDFDWERYASRTNWNTNARRALIQQLLRHLFVRYPLAPFMDQAFWSGHPLLISWYLQLGLGTSPRKLKGLPFTLTKRMGALFAAGMNSFTILQNLRRSQVLGLGGSDRLAYTIARSKLGYHTILNHRPEVEDFYRRFFQWLIANEASNAKEVETLLWYIDWMKFRPRRILKRDGSHFLAPPEKPGLEVKGRKYSRLLAEAQELKKNVQYRRSFSSNQIYDVVLDFFEKNEKGQEYRIFPLMSRDLIIEEGRAMRHCVSSHLGFCEKGTSSIWSLTSRKSDQRLKRLLTIAVNENLQITELKGFANRMPSSYEIKVIRKWAEKEKLHLPDHVY